MFIWPYKNVMCCIKHAIIDVILNTEKNCHITVYYVKVIIILNLIINTNIHVFVFCA